MATHTRIAAAIVALVSVGCAHPRSPAGALPPSTPTTTPAPAPSATAGAESWRPWSTDVFARARAENRTVLLLVARRFSPLERAALESIPADLGTLLVSSDPDEAPEVGDFARVSASVLESGTAFPIALLMNADGVPHAALSADVPIAEWPERLRALAREQSSVRVVDDPILDRLRRAQRSSPAGRPPTRALAEARGATQRAQLAASPNGAGKPQASLGSLLLALEASRGSGETAALARTLGASPRPDVERRLDVNAWRLMLATELGAPAVEPASAEIVDWMERALLDERGLFRAGTYAAAAEPGTQTTVDDRIFTAAEGLAIGALAVTGSRQGRPERVARASRAAEALLMLVGPATSLQHGFDGARSLGPARLDDYAALGLGLVRLYDATADKRWLGVAQAVAEAATGALWDSTADGFYLAPEPHAPLPVRLKTGFDDARPSGNAVMALFLDLLADRGGRLSYRDLARRTVQAFAGDLAEAPSGMEGMWAAALRVLEKTPTPVAPTPGSFPSRVTDGPLVVTALASSPRLRAGESTEIRLRLALTPGVTVTPHGAVGRGLVPLSVTLLEPDLVSGPPVYPPAGADAAVIAVRVPPSAPPGPRAVRVSVRCQACATGGGCRQPLRATLEVELTIVGR